MHSCDLIRDSEFEVNQAGLCTDRLQVTYRMSRTTIKMMMKTMMSAVAACTIDVQDSHGNGRCRWRLQCHCFTLVSSSSSSPSSFVPSSATCCVVLYTCSTELVHMACGSSVGVPCRRRFEVVEEGLFLGCNLPGT